jgi:uncharacterized membrane protein (DUF2068 family)
LAGIATYAALNRSRRRAESSSAAAPESTSAADAGGGAVASQAQRSLSSRVVAQPHDRGLIVIGCFKLVKAALLVAVVIGLLRLLTVEDAARSLETWVEHLRIDPQNRLIHSLAQRLLGLDPRKLEAIGVGTFLYAAVFATEGIGLLLGKRWAEYLTLVVTISFIPIELFEVVKHASMVKAAVTTVNVAIAIYLSRQLSRQRQK